MSKQLLLRLTPAVWLVGLISISLIVAACGSATEPTTEATTAPVVETEEAADTAVDTSATEAAIEEEPETTPAGSAGIEAATPAEAECQPVDPNEDVIAGVTEYMNEYIDANATNDAIAVVSDSDWAKGPADAPITLIEYGDFQ